MEKIELLSEVNETELRKKLAGIKEKSKEARLGGDSTEMFHLGTVAGVDIGYATLPVAASISILLASFVIFSISGLFTLQNAYHRYQQLKIEATLRKNDLLKKISELENDQQKAAYEKYLQEALENVDAWYQRERIRVVGRAVLSGLLQVAIGVFGTAVSIAFLFGVGASLQMFVPAMLVITNIAAIGASAWTTVWDVIKMGAAYVELNAVRKNILDYERNHPEATKDNDSVLKILFQQEAHLQKHYNSRVNKMAASASLSALNIAGIVIGVVTILGLLSVPPFTIGLLVAASFVITAGTFFYYNRDKINSIFDNTIKSFKNIFSIEDNVTSKKQLATTMQKNTVSHKTHEENNISDKLEENTPIIKNEDQASTKKIFSFTGKVRFPWSKQKANNSSIPEKSSTGEDGKVSNNEDDNQGKDSGETGRKNSRISH